MDTKIVRVVTHYTETLDVYVKVPAHVSDEDVMEYYKSNGANGEFEQQDASWDWDFAEEVDEDDPFLKGSQQPVWPMIAPFPGSEFPYEEIRDKNGDYFLTLEAAKAAGHEEDHIWSVTVDDDHDDETGDELITFGYGHPNHYVNCIGFIATEEARVNDGESYVETERLPADR